MMKISEYDIKQLKENIDILDDFLLSCNCDIPRDVANAMRTLQSMTVHFYRGVEIDNYMRIGR